MPIKDIDVKIEKGVPLDTRGGTFRHLRYRSEWNEFFKKLEIGDSFVAHRHRKQSIVDWARALGYSVKTRVVRAADGITPTDDYRIWFMGRK